MRKRARQRLARPSMFIVPMKLVLMVLMGLYLFGGENKEREREGEGSGDWAGEKGNG